MPDYYHAPALILTALLLPAFGYLYLRFRDTRNLFWFLGFVFRWPRWSRSIPLCRKASPGGDVLLAAGCRANLRSAQYAMFLGSLSPLRFRLGGSRILFVVPYIFPSSSTPFFSMEFTAACSPRANVSPLPACLPRVIRRWHVLGNSKRDRTCLAGSFVQRHSGLPRDLDLLHAGSCPRAHLHRMRQPADGRSPADLCLPAVFSRRLPQRDWVFWLVALLPADTSLGRSPRGFRSQSHPRHRHEQGRGGGGYDRACP